MNLDNLNPQQLRAVQTVDGPVLILAGAGSGKTTVLVNRISYMINECGIYPSSVLAITFTNKAANEIKERVSSVMGEDMGYMWIGTFHSVCVRMLRRYIDRAGYEPSFVIYDSSDQKTVIKECMKELNIDDTQFPIRSVISIISKAKDDLMEPELFEQVYSSDHRLKTVAGIYSLYQKKLKRNNALDFDDILYITVKLLSSNEDMLEYYRNKFRYILIDEYQDTNNAQYMLVSLLAQEHRNLCVVGDDDQSIYKFRGANIRNILDFEKEFPEALVIKLEQNYRSTQNILDAANCVIANNEGRKGKALWTSKGEGEKLHRCTAANAYEEARYIADHMRELVKEEKKYSDCAVLYRTNAQSRVIEELFVREGIPYRVFGGLKFYDRKEIKDAIAYLRIINNPSDDVSARRIVNEPKRGIGISSVNRAAAIAYAEDISFMDVIANPEKYEELKRPAPKLKAFVKMIDDLRKLSEGGMPVSELFARVMNESGYTQALILENTVEAQTRLENISEFESVIAEYEKENESNLADFLESVSLISDIDSYDEDTDAAALMTVHSAKGLEFPVVFLSGLEEGLFPTVRAMKSDSDIEEERRLCYVAITRAKDNLFLTCSRSRILYGRSVYYQPSRFLDEIPPDYFIDDTPAPKKKEDETHTAKKKRVNPLETIYHPTSAEQNAVDFKPGDRVEHRKFGCGTVISISRIGKDAKLEIEFDTAGVKHLMALFARLKKIG